MPLKFKGTLEERVARVEKKGRRCHGDEIDNHMCPRTAVVEQDVRPAANDDAPIQTYKTCSFPPHRYQFDNDPSVAVVEVRDLPIVPSRPVAPGRPGERVRPALQCGCGQTFTTSDELGEHRMAADCR